MKLIVWKNHFGGQILYRSLDPSKKLKNLKKYFFTFREKMAVFDETWVPSVMQDKITNAKWTKPEKTERIANCLRLAANRGGEFWTILEKAVKQIVTDYHLPKKAEEYLANQIKGKFCNNFGEKIF